MLKICTTGTGSDARCEYFTSLQIFILQVLLSSWRQLKCDTDTRSLFTLTIPTSRFVSLLFPLACKLCDIWQDLAETVHSHILLGYIRVNFLGKCIKTSAASLREELVYVWTKCCALHRESGMRLPNKAFGQSVRMPHGRFVYLFFKLQFVLLLSWQMIRMNRVTGSQKEQFIKRKMDYKKI